MFFLQDFVLNKLRLILELSFRRQISPLAVASYMTTRIAWQVFSLLIDIEKHHD